MVAATSLASALPPILPPIFTAAWQASSQSALSSMHGSTSFRESSVPISPSAARAIFFSSGLFARSIASLSIFSLSAAGRSAGTPARRM